MTCKINISRTLNREEKLFLRILKINFFNDVIESNMETFYFYLK